MKFSALSLAIKNDLSTIQTGINTVSKSILDVSSGITNLKFGQDHGFEDLQDEKTLGNYRLVIPSKHGVQADRYFK